jgi:hypothetical protein
MKKNTFALVLMVGLFVLRGYCAVNQNVNFLQGISLTDDTFTSKEGRFSFIPPVGFDKFNFEKRPKKTDAGDLEIHQYSSNLARGTCLIAYYDLPESLFQSKSIQKMLEDGRDGSIKNANAVLDKESAITVDGYAGLSFYAHIKNGDKIIYTRSDFVIAKPRLYNYLYLSLDESELYKTDVKNFFKSFHIQN